MLKERRIVLGVTGGIAAYKAAELVRELVRREARVRVIMTDHAREFIAPLTFETLSGNPVARDLFRMNGGFEIDHIALAQFAELIVIAPATANVIGKMAAGIADDLLTTVFIAATAPTLICPAMNDKMYANPVVKENLARLVAHGHTVLEPGYGELACRTEGQGRLPDAPEIAEEIETMLTEKDLRGERLLVTAGPTQEPFDPVRYITNYSSGKMGYALARSAFRRGAEVVLVHGPTHLACPAGVTGIAVTTAQQMYEAVMSLYLDATVIIKAAAVADFRCAKTHDEKIKKDQASLTMALEPTPDILEELGRIAEQQKQLLVGFAAESSDIEANGRKKLARKNLDIIAVNNICSEQTGFEVDTNQLVLIDDNGSSTLPHTSKIKTADLLWDHIVDNGFLKRS